MTSTWLPPWLALVFVAVLVVAVAMQLQHLSAMPGPHAVWHAGHVFMGLGMIVMYLPTPSMLVSAPVGSAVFAAAALASAGLLLAWSVQRRTGGLLWLLLLLDLAWMAYMFQAMVAPIRWVSILGVVWFAAVAVGWGSDLFGRILAPWAAGATQVAAVGSSGDAERPPSGIPEGEAHDRLLRASPTAMALAMSYMFLTMVVGSSTMADMSGMHHVHR